MYRMGRLGFLQVTPETFFFVLYVPVALFFFPQLISLAKVVHTYFTLSLSHIAHTDRSSIFL